MPTPEEKAAFWKWVGETYRPEEVRTLQQWSEAIWGSPYYQYWQAYDKPYRMEGLPRTGMPLIRREYEDELIPLFRGYVDRGEMTEAQARTKLGEIDYWINTYGFSPNIPYYGAATYMRRQAEAGAPQVMPSGATITPEGEYIPAREGISPTGGILGTTGPLGFGAPRRPGQIPTGAREAEAAARGVGEMPSAAVPFYEMVEGLASPAMQQFFRSQFPYLMTMFGGEGARQEWWGEKQERAGELARLGAKRRGQQWVAEKKLPYIRTGPGVPSPYIESYQATQRKISGYRRREAGLRGMAEPRDPWLAYLEQYPFLEKFITTPPQQRGFFPARFAPMTRWL